MMKMPMSATASCLLRSLLARSGVSRDRILLTDYRSTDWQSLTFTGERHELTLRVPGPKAGPVVERISGGLSDDEFGIPGQIVADILVTGEPIHCPDGSITLAIEALTIAE